MGSVGSCAAYQVSLALLWKPVLLHMLTTTNASSVTTRAQFMAEVLEIDTALTLLSECVLLCGDVATSLTVSVVVQLKQKVASLKVDAATLFETLSECDETNEGVSEDAWHLIKDDFTLASEQLRAYRQTGSVQWKVTEQDIVNASTDIQAVSLLTLTRTREEFIARVLEIDKSVSVLQECTGVWFIALIAFRFRCRCIQR